MKIKKILCFVLTAVVLFVTAFSFSGSAEVTRSGTVEYTKLMSDAGTTGHTTSGKASTLKCYLSTGQSVTILGSKYDTDFDIWYKVSTVYNKKTVTGYVLASKVKTKSSIAYNSNFDKNLLNFPESYRASLKALHKKYPNWKFIPEDTYMTLSTAVNCEYRPGENLLPRKLVELTYEGEKWRDTRAKVVSGNTITWKTKDGDNWTYASKYGINYYMNPVNFLNENDIFMFMPHSYDSKTQTENDLRTMVKGTFLENGYTLSGKLDKDAYIKDMMEAAKQSGVSPYVIASMIIVEQGVKGDSELISGVYKGYEGYYNFFNRKASGTTRKEVVTNGLKEAKSNNWTTRRAAIIGGAKDYKNGYLDQGQDTYYYMDYNVIYKDWGHQYAESIYDAKTKGARLKNGCMSNPNAALQFKIPVYIEVANTDTDSSSSKTSSSSTSSSSKNVKRGDINKDKTVDIIDAAMLRKHLLNIKKLSVKNNPEADANADGVIDVIDAAMIRKHILKIKLIGG